MRFFMRCQQLDGLPDLDLANLALGPAPQRTLEGQVDRFEIFTSLGSLFRTRSRKVGEVGELDRSIEKVGDVVLLVPVGHAALPES